LPERERELDAIQYVIDQIDAMKVVRPPDEVHIEGMLCFGMTISLLGLIKEVITKTISQQEQIGKESNL
jgi:putative exporter of polyketide antibiotics